MSERKLVEAFRTFFEKSVAPNVSRNDEVMREWNHLNKIISADPIDYSQIEFYLLLSNKNSGSSSQTPNNRGSQQNIGSSNKITDADNKFRYSDFNVIMEKNNFDKNNFEKKGSFMGNSASKKYFTFHVGRTSSAASKDSKKCWSTTKIASKTSAKKKPGRLLLRQGSTPLPTAHQCGVIDCQTSISLINSLLISIHLCSSSSEKIESVLSTETA